MDGHENELGSPSQPNATQETLGQPSVAPVAPSQPSPAPEMPSAAPEPTSATFETPTSAPETPATGGIFSSDDTRIETENLPDIVPESASQAPMGAISPALRTESTVTGDLQLGGPTKKKKWPFIALVVAAMAVVVIVLVARIIPTMTSGSSSADHTKYIESYNKFANYLLSGRTDPAGEDTSVSNGAATRALQERDAAFFNEASRLYSIFLDEYDSDNSAFNAILPIYTNLSIVSAYTQFSLLDVNTAMAYYAENGKDATNARITESLNELQTSTSTSAYSDELYNDAKEFVDTELELLDLVDRGGCFNGHVVDPNCVAAVQVPVDLQSRITSANSALSSMDQIVSDALNNLISAVITTKESLQ